MLYLSYQHVTNLAVGLPIMRVRGVLMNFSVRERRALNN